jgi:hypothetical protein
MNVMTLASQALDVVTGGGPETAVFRADSSIMTREGKFPPLRNGTIAPTWQARYVLGRAVSGLAIGAAGVLGWHAMFGTLKE